MSEHRDRDLANLHELQLALVRPETPTPAPVPVPVLVEPVEPPSRSPCLKVQAKRTRTWRH